MPQDELTEAVKRWERKAAAVTRANKKVADLKAERDAAKNDTMRLLGERGHEGVKAGGNLVSTYDFDHYYVNEASREDFEAWAKDQDEEYLEPTRRVRADVLKNTCQELEENGQPLPPGVSKYVEPKISKRKA